MKLFKKVLAVVLVGAMAVSMLTACGDSKSSKVKDALKDFDIKMDSVMVQDTEKMMGGLQQLTEKVTSGTVKLNDETQMKKARDEFGFEEAASDSAYKKENPVEHAIMVKASESDDTELVG